MNPRTLTLFVPVLSLLAGILAAFPAAEASAADASATTASDSPPADAPPTGATYSEPPDSHSTAPASQRPPHSPLEVDERSPVVAAADCDVSDFADADRAGLVALIKASSPECVNTLFSVAGDDAHSLFRESRMVAVAEAFATEAETYSGDAGADVLQLVLYLRAGYYVQYYLPEIVGPYGPDLRAAVRNGLDTFFAHPNSRLVDDANGRTLSEAVILIDSAEENARYLYVVERLLNDYDSEYREHWYMMSALNSVYTVMFRGHQLPEFVAAVRADSGVLYTMYLFAVRNLDLLGGDWSYVTSNAGRELGRFLQHDSFPRILRPYVKDLLDRSDMLGRTAPLWVGVAEMADAYDFAECGYYDVCDLRSTLRDAVLAVDHDCGEGVVVKAQELSSQERSATCESVLGQNAYFQQLAQADGPVPDDYNDSLEIVAFDSSVDYQTYAGVIYQISTNNGGMYLEGDPSREGNTPRFIAYEAEWLPSFEIWNLNHEYTHYLDGRFNMYGDFAAAMTTPTVWWLEGFGEYVSYSYRDLEYEEALAEAGNGTYDLSELFDTTYDHDANRVYRWGYLAVRFMLENRRADVDAVLGFYRSGDWDAAREHLTSVIGTRYDQAWRDWLQQVGS